MTDWSGWIPVGVERSGEAASLVWFRLGDYRFDDAYFYDTAARCARHPFNLAFCRRTPFDALEEAAAGLPPSAPCGMLFHMSRCGSTLVSRSLAAIPETLVISEAPPVDAVIRAALRDSNVSREQQVRWLRALAAIFGAAGGAHKYYVWKLDAWHTFDIALLERAFPDAAWMFLYRNPVEVLVSHAMRSSYMMSAANAPDFAGVPLVEAVKIPRVEYWAQVLGRVVEAVARHGIDGDRLVNYDELPQGIWERVAPRFGIHLGKSEIEAVQRRAAYDAKQPEQPFQDDRAAKRAAATPELLAAASRWIDPHVQRLESRRPSGR